MFVSVRLIQNAVWQENDREASMTVAALQPGAVSCIHTKSADHMWPAGPSLSRHQVRALISEVLTLEADAGTVLGTPTPLGRGSIKVRGYHCVCLYHSCMHGRWHCFYLRKAPWWFQLGYACTGSSFVVSRYEFGVQHTHMWQNINASMWLLAITKLVIITQNWVTRIKSSLKFFLATAISLVPVKVCFVL